MVNIIVQKTADRIHDIRKAKGLSGDEVAARAGIHRATYYRYEGGDLKNMKLDKLHKIAEALEVHPADLIVWDWGSEKPLNSENSELSEARRALLAEIDGMTEEEVYHLLDVIRAVKGKK